MKKVMVITWLAVAALAVLNLTYHPVPDPDVIYPMANQNIEWTYAKCPPAANQAGR